MPDCLIIGVLIKVCFVKRSRQSICPTEKLVNALDGVVQTLAGCFGKYFHAIASGDNQTLPNNFAVNEGAQASRARFVSEGETLAHLHRRRFVIDSN
jgi:hypothetical protein